MATPLVNWSYADWRSQSTPAAQLERLKLHMQEVSGYVLESMSKGRSLKLQDAYLDRLEKNIAQLERGAALSSAATRFGVSQFVRGSGS